MARKAATRVGGKAQQEYGARTSLEVTKADLEALGAKAGDYVEGWAWIESSSKTLACPNADGAIISQQATSGFATRGFYATWDGSKALKIEWDGTSLGSILVVEVWRGHDTAQPIDSVSTWTNFSSKSSITAPSVKTLSDHTVQKVMQVNINGVALKSAPEGFTLGVNYPPSLAYRERVAEGETGTTACTLNSSASGCVCSYAIRGAAEEESSSTTVEPPAAAATASALAPTVTATRNTTVEPPTASATASALAPTVTTTRSVVVEPPAAVATASAPAPTVEATKKASEPSATTAAASDITQTSAVLHGTISTKEGCEWRFLYGETESYGEETPWVVLNEAAEGEPVEATVEGLEPGTTYHFILVSEDYEEGFLFGEDLTFTTQPVYARVAVSQEYPRTDLHYEIETPSARFYRWGRDEPKPDNVPSGGGFSSTAPGGFDSISLTLPRKPGVDYGDLVRLSTVRALGPGGELACEARLKEAPRISGNQMSVSPVTEGWIAHLQDDTTAAEIYIDRDLGSWQGPGSPRLQRLLELSRPGTGVGELSTDITGTPSLRLHVDGAWGAGIIPAAELWYDAGPSARIANTLYGFISAASTSWILEWSASDNDKTAAETTGDIYTVAEDAEAFSAPAVPRRYIFWNWRFNAAESGVDGYEFAINIFNVAVIGSHGLTGAGATYNFGYLASDVVANAVSRWAPALNYSTGSNGTIRPTSLYIPHLVFKEQTTALAILEGANAYEGRLYGVWDDQTFHLYDWGDIGRKWRARVGPTDLTETGPTTERLRNGVIVSFQDVDGITKKCGPVGSGCDFESAYLEDKDPENPANERGIKMYGPPIDIGQSTSYASAEIPIAVGMRILQVLKETDRSGTAKIVGYCEDDKGVIHPAWKARAGDLITFIDSSEPVERRIIRADYDEASLTNTITLDAPAEDVPALLAQLGVSIADLGI